MNAFKSRRPRHLHLRRRGLTPSKTVLAYLLALMLAGWHESARLAGWFEDQALARQGRLAEAAFSLSHFLSAAVAPHGPDQLNRFEDRLLAAFKPAETPAAEPEPARAEAEISPRTAESLQPPAEPPSPPPLTIDYGRLTLAAPEPEEEPAPAEVIPAEEPPPAEEPRIFNPSRVLLLGDSMMLEGLGPQLQRELKKNEGLNVIRDGRYGTGLARLDAFDWLAYFDQMLDKHRPELVILTIGANDTQDIVDAGHRRLRVAGEQWNEVYRQRAADLLARAEAKGVEVFWVSLPVMGREPYGQRAANINVQARAACEAAPGCRFWDSTASVADGQGRYSAFLTNERGQSVRVRAKDAIHLTESGGRLMAAKFLADTADWADYVQRPEEEPADEAPAPKPAEAGETAPASDIPPLPPTPAEAGGAAPASDIPPLPPTPAEAAEAVPLPPPPRETAPGLFEEELPPPALKQPRTPEEAESPWPWVDPEEFYEDHSIPYAPPLPPLRENPPGGAGQNLGRAEEIFRLPAPSAGEGEDSAPSFAPLTVVRYHSKARGREVTCYLARPQGPGPFPTVLMLHGAWDGPESWPRRVGPAELAELADHLGLVLVMVDGEPFGWYLDGRETAVESCLLKELLPRLKERPEVDGRRLGLLGLSMGGHGALTLVLKHPELFLAASSLSGVLDLAAHAGDDHAVNRELKIDRVLGPAGPSGRDWRPHGAQGLTEARPEALAGRSLALSVGRDDRLTRAENRRYHQLLQDLGVPHFYSEAPGGHDWDFWRAQLPVHLEFLAESLKKAPGN